MGRRKWFILIVALQIAVLLAMIGMKWSTLTFGERILLKTLPVDPWDVFRGDYIVLNYEIATLDLDQVAHDDIIFKPNDSVFVVLKPGEKYWAAEGVYLHRPEDGSRFIKARVSYYDEYSGTLHLDYGIGSYYVPQHQGREIENQRVPLEVEVSIDRWGNSAVSRLFLEGQEIEFQ